MLPLYCHTPYVCLCTSKIRIPEYHCSMFEYWLLVVLPSCMLLINFSSAVGGSGSCQGFGRQGHLGKTGEDGTAAGQPPGGQWAAVKFKISLTPSFCLCNECPPQAPFTLGLLYCGIALRCSVQNQLSTKFCM